MLVVSLHDPRTRVTRATFSGLQIVIDLQSFEWMTLSLRGPPGVIPGLLINLRLVTTLSLIVVLFTGLFAGLPLACPHPCAFCWRFSTDCNVFFVV
jgi:hypothetical protein